jgi:Protein of unknown function (DUF2946)
MLSKKLFRLIHKFALFAILFASLAPSISHAFATNAGVNSFAQEICTSAGKKVNIQVKTTKGQYLSVAFALKQTQQPNNMAKHLAHCPFCASPSFVADLPNLQSDIIRVIEATAQKSTQYAVPFYIANPHPTPPAQAPPSNI